MFNTLNKYKWFPPAETKIPLSSILKSLLPTKSNFKQELCNYLGVQHCILAGSGRALLAELLQALKNQDNERRDEVLIPGYTCYSVAASIARAGLKIRVYDIEPETFSPDIESVEHNINGKTLAILSQHLFGIPAPVDEFHGIAQKNNITHIEDAAQGLGGTLSGRPLGVTGDFGLFSFDRGKSLPLGCGGALIGSNKVVLDKIHSGRRTKGFKQLAVTGCTQILSHPRIYGVLEALPLGLGETIFDPSFTAKSMPETLDRLGTRTLSTLKDLNVHRNTIAKVYTDNLPQDTTISISNDARPVYTRFPVMTSKLNQDIPETLKRYGVRRMYPNAIIDVPAIRPYLSDHNQTTPGAAIIAQKLATLPTHKNISENTAQDIASQVENHV